MEHTDKDFFEAVSGLVEQITGLVDDNLPYYSAFTDDVLHNRVTDLVSRERQLDSMLSYCFDDRILLLYKKIIRKLFTQHPETVKCYVDAYYMMYGDGGDSE
jgi:hypothetical protein